MKKFQKQQETNTIRKIVINVTNKVCFFLNKCFLQSFKLFHYKTIERNMISIYIFFHRKI